MAGGRLSRPLSAPGTPRAAQGCVGAGASAALDPITRCSLWSLGECASDEDAPTGTHSRALPREPRLPRGPLVFGTSLTVGSTQGGVSQASCPPPQRLPVLPSGSSSLRAHGRRDRAARAHLHGQTENTHNSTTIPDSQCGTPGSLKTALPEAGRSSPASCHGVGVGPQERRQTAGPGRGGERCQLGPHAGGRGTRMEPSAGRA